jgi:hypothetical protein
MHNKSVLVAQTVEMAESEKAIIIARIPKRCSKRAREFAVATVIADEYGVRIQEGNIGQ